MNKRMKILVGLLAVLVAAAFLSLVIYLKIQPPTKTQGQAVYFEIKPAESSFQIADGLMRHGLIKSKWLFLFFLKMKKGVIQAGVYELKPSLNLTETVKILTEGQVKEWTVTFPEGFSTKDMAERLEKMNIVDKELFLKETSLVGKYKNEFPFLADVRASNLEGYLFPDTYRFSIKTTAEEIVKKMLSNFNKKVNNTLGEEIKKQGKNMNDVIILASIVEREAKGDDRAKIASVYLNRLNKGMKLEADPTVQYAKGNWGPIKQEDYQNVDSPYNTYKYAGLPPSPIANPGLSSIKAVLYPEQTNYLYFFHTKEGETIFSTTQKEHEQKKKEYLK
jgi:UPF0755 protein